MRTALTAVALLALVAVTAVGTRTEHIFDGRSGWPLLWWTAGAWALFALAFLALRRVRGRAAGTLLVVGAVLMAGIGVVGPPNTSTDSARYAWDGIVSDAGVSPYAHVPVDDALDPLRVPWLFPSPVPGASGAAACPQLRTDPVRSLPAGDLLCSTLNRSAVPTIYPPVAQGWFATVRAAVPVTAQYWPMQVGGALVSLLTGLALAVVLRRRRLDVRWAALWAWSPFVTTEAVTNSHIDALGVLLVVLATAVATPLVAAGVARHGSSGGRGRAAAVGALVGLSAAVKFVPVIAAPPLARRRPFTVAAAAIVTFAAVYVPYVVTTGWSVVGYLPGYLKEQGYDGGSGFTLASWVLPGSLATVVSLAAIVVIAALSFWRADPDRPWLAQLAGTGAILLVVSPPYAWYALVVVPFVALTRRWEWLVLPLTMTAHMLVPAVFVSRTMTLVAVGVVLAGWLVRRYAARRPDDDARPSAVARDDGGGAPDPRRDPLSEGRTA
ncbi:MAG: glycosyltransferase 87 family protein [Terracoccus sp.]